MPGHSRGPLRLLRPLLIATVLAFAPALCADDEPSVDDSAAEAAAAPLPSDFAGLLARLPVADYEEKREIIDGIVATKHASAKAVLEALIDDHLYSRDTDKQVFIATETGDGYTLTDPLTLAAAGTAAEGLSKVGTNNALRKILRSALARFQLTDPDRKTRLAAVRGLLRGGLDEATTALLRARIAEEKDSTVLKALTSAVAQADLASPDPKLRLAATDALANSLDVDVYTKLKAMAGIDAEPTESDPKVRTAAALASHHIALWRGIYESVETLFFGLSLGSVLVLAAIGLAITFGVMGVINMAHGELMMLGAYTAYVMQQLLPNQLALAMLLSIPAAFLVAGLAGVAIERSIVRFLYGRPLETLLATFGVSLILQQTVRSIFSPLNRSVATPEFMSGQWQVNEALSLNWNRLYIVLFTLVVFAGLQLILRRTTLGLKVRAVSQNRAMSRAMGIKSEWVDAITFGLGSGIAGVAGVALSQLTNVGPNLGQSYIVDSFMVVVFGGVGNLWGTLIGGMGLGVAGKLLEPAVGAVIAKILMLVFIILFIQRRKQGLFPQKGRAAEGH